MSKNLREIEPPVGVPSRYTQRPYPRYRHVPGLHPHPVSHPDGHSYNASGAHPEAEPLLPPERWCESDDYLYGVDLYNHGYWWEAHEAWEGLWQQTDKQNRQGNFLQGLIQVSAAHLKRHVGQPVAVERLLERGNTHLDAARAGLAPGMLFMNVDIPDFQDRVHRYFDGTDPGFPAITLDLAPDGFQHDTTQM